MSTQKEKINHPPHYGGKDNPYEAIKVIEAWELGFHLGSAVKYISRAGKKDSDLDDLKKAKWFVAREIANRERSSKVNWEKVKESSYHQKTIEALSQPIGIPSFLNEAEQEEDKKPRVFRFIGDEVLAFSYKYIKDPRLSSFCIVGRGYFNTHVKEGFDWLEKQHWFKKEWEEIFY